jgi:hypothetical protein
MKTKPQLSEEKIPLVRKKNWSLVPDGGLIPGQTGRLTVGHNMTLTLRRKDYSKEILRINSSCGITS